jgi:RHS repeat-associated protein
MRKFVLASAASVVVVLSFLGCSDDGNSAGPGVLPDGGSTLEDAGGGTDAGGDATALPETPTWPAGAAASLTPNGPTSLKFAWPAAEVRGGVASYVVREGTTEIARLTGADLATVVTGLAVGSTHTYTVTAYDADGDASSPLEATAVVREPTPSEIAPAPVGPAPSFADRTGFLWQGPDPLQREVDAGAIAAARVVVLRGRVLDGAGQPVAGVRVRVLDHAEFGYALTRTDGAYDLATNGGGDVPVVFEKADYLTAQRGVKSAWNAYVAVDDVALLAKAPAQAAVVTPATMSAAAAVPGPTTTDTRGARTPEVVVEPGTTITAVKADGSSIPIPSATVRLTEYTAGERGRSQMPGSLPPSSAYTYAIELSVDEAEAIGATRVTFSQPVAFHVDNFLGFAVGKSVPVGYFDRAKNRWVGMEAATIVKVLAIANGMPSLDTNGDGVAENTAALTSAGYTDGELRAIAARYGAGKSIWRARTDHFTPFDCNTPWRPPSDAQDPRTTPDRPKDSNGDDCGSNGSLIGCVDQSLRQRVPIEGTGLGLVYSSLRVPGRLSAFERTIDLAGSGSLPASLKALDFTATVAGKTTTATFAPSAGLTTPFRWDGRDAYGRTVGTAATAEFAVGYRYDAAYLPGTAWAALSIESTDLTTSAGTEFTSWQRWTDVLGTSDARRVGLGGWLLDAHHVYDVAHRTLYLGDGSSVRDASAGEYRKFAGGGTIQPNLSSGRDPNPTSGTAMDLPIPGAQSQLAYAADGTLWMNTGYVWRIDASGNWTRVVKPVDVGAYAFGGGFALTPDGGFLVGDFTNSGIYRYDPATGVTSRQTAQVTATCPSDGALLSSVTIPKPQAIATAPDGSYAVYSTTCSRVYLVGTDGRLSTLAGKAIGTGGSTCTNFASTTAVDARSKPMPEVLDMAYDPAGNLVVSSTCNQVLRITPAGRMTALAGTSVAGFSGDGGPATAAKIFRPWGLAIDPTGGVYFADSYSNRVRYIGADGVISTVAGSGAATASAIEGRNATGVPIGQIRYLARRPDGVLTVRPANVTASEHLYHLTAGVTLSATAGGNLSVMAPSGREYFAFDGSGKHLATYDAVTRAAKRTFAYTADGKLASVVDADGNRVTFGRDASGNLTSVTGPSGRSTAITVDASGWIARVAAPSGATTVVATAADGLLASFVDPVGTTKSYTYDSAGRLSGVTGSSSGNASFARTNTATGHVVTETRGSYTSTTEVAVAADGTRVVRRAGPSGSVTTATTSADGKTTTTARADGTAVTTIAQDDPVLGKSHPILASMSVRTPAGVTYAVTATRTATMSTPGDASTLTRRVDTLKIGSSTTTQTYDVAAKTITKVRPSGRTSVTTLDARGRPVSVVHDAASALTPATYTYGTNGLVSEMAQGPRKWRVAYDAAGAITSIDDGLGRRAQIARDDAGRMRRFTTPLGRVYEWTYDAAGRATQVALPSTAVHTLGRDAFGRLVAWTPPGGSALARTFDATGRLTGTRLGGGRSQAWSYDGSGRTTGLVTTEASTSFAYVGSTARLASTSWTPATGTANAATSTWDGPLVTQVATTGTSATTFAYTYDSAFNLAAVTRNGGSLYAFTRNADGAITGDGVVTFTRGGPAGAVSVAAVGSAATTDSFDAYGAVTSRKLTLGGTTLFELGLTYDDAGRVVARRSVVAGVTRDDTLAYDADDELTSVTRGGAAVEAYAYDVDGNRSSGTSGGTARAATFDASGRLATLGGVAYTFTADGFLTGRGSERFTPGSRGELLRYEGAAGTVTYGYDGLGRRIARMASSGTTTFEYARPDAPNLVTAVVDGSGVWSFHYDDRGFLVAADRGSTRYLVATDQVGSVRALFTTAGALVKSLEYDAFGVVLADSAPSFSFPLGFAGGVVDADSGLVHFGARDYEPASGRWTTPDPFLFDGRQLNLYAYASNAPTLRRDPSGLASYSISGYAGVGFNVEFAITTEGFSSCVGAGVGLGVSGSVNPLGDLASDSTGTDLFSKIEAGIGIEGLLDAEFELKGTKSLTSPCSKISRSWGINGPGGIGLYGDEHTLDQDGVWTSESTNILDNHGFADFDPSDHTEHGFAEGEGHEAKHDFDADLGASASISGSAGLCSTYKW